MMQDTMRLVLKSVQARNKKLKEEIKGYQDEIKILRAELAERLVVPEVPVELPAPEPKKTRKTKTEETPSDS